MFSLPAVIVLSVLQTGAAQEPAARTTDKPADAAQATTAFGWDLYRALRRHDGNLLVSPYSVAVALAMTSEGAAGETAEEMKTVLHLGPGSPGPGHEALAAALRPRKVVTSTSSGRHRVDAYELDVANRLFGQKGAHFIDAFVKTVAAHYGAPLARVDFSQRDATRKLINDWVAKQTHDRIENIVPPDMPTPDTVLALVNAIYFKASWQYSFDKRRTTDAPFTLASGDRVEVPTMGRVGTYRYAATDEVRILEIPYLAADTSMLVIVPRKAGGLPALESRVDAALATKWIAALAPTSVDVRLPRFEFTMAEDLAKVLPAMGMKRAFSSSAADFSRMAEERLFIGHVLHKAFIAVDEAGTEAAAATVVMMKRGGRPPQEPVLFAVDRPFLFAIRHSKTGCVLFLGRVQDPRS